MLSQIHNLHRYAAEGGDAGPTKFGKFGKNPTVETDFLPVGPYKLNAADP
jgi:hypothetical protein